MTQVAMTVGLMSYGLLPQAHKFHARIGFSGPNQQRGAAALATQFALSAALCGGVGLASHVAGPLLHDAIQTLPVLL